MTAWREYGRGSDTQCVSEISCPRAHLMTVVTTSPIAKRASPHLPSWPYFATASAAKPPGRDAVDVSERNRLPRLMSSVFAIGPSWCVG